MSIVNCFNKLVLLMSIKVCFQLITMVIWLNFDLGEFETLCKNYCVLDSSLERQVRSKISSKD